LKALVFGARGGIGKELCRLLTEQGHEVIAIHNKNLKWTIPKLLSTHKPDWVFNCVGKLGNNASWFEEVFVPNVRTNWEMVRYYLNHKDDKVQIVWVGSSAYSSGRKDYILYSSSKAALHNMWQGASENFENTNINIGLIHPTRVDTPMVAHFPKKECLSAETVALAMINLTNNMKSSTLLEIGI